MVLSQAPGPSSEHTRHKLTPCMAVCGSSLKRVKLQRTPDIFTQGSLAGALAWHTVGLVFIYWTNEWMNEWLQVKGECGRNNSFVSWGGQAGRACCPQELSISRGLKIIKWKPSIQLFTMTTALDWWALRNSLERFQSIWEDHYQPGFFLSWFF